MRTKEQMGSINSVVRENKDIFQNLYQEKDVKKLFKEAGLKVVNLYIKNYKSEKLHYYLRLWLYYRKVDFDFFDTHKTFKKEEQSLFQIFVLM